MKNITPNRRRLIAAVRAALLANDMDAYRSASQGTVDAMAQGAASGDEDDRIIRLLAQRVMQQLLDREA